MLEPLKQFMCDMCGEIIEDPEKGYVIWKTDENRLSYDFKVIHKSICDDKSYTSSMDINSFFGEHGIAQLLSFLGAGQIIVNSGRNSRIRVKNMDEFVDLFRRFQSPYYEEARKKFNDPTLLEKFYDSNEIYPYMTEVLKRIIEEF